MSFLYYLGKRITGSLIIIFMVTLITFFVLMLIPGDPAQLMMGMEADPQQLDSLREAMGLNKPWYFQYLDWTVNFIKGDWGSSRIYGEEVLDLIIQRVPVTVSISLLSLFISIFISFILGVLSAIYKDSYLDYFSRSIMQLGAAIPSFWSGMIFIIIFSVYLKWFPISGFQSPYDGVFSWLRSITLPAVVLAISQMGSLIRIIRSSMLSSIKEEYIDLARIKGLSPKYIYIRYALRNALIAPITILGMLLAKLMGGAIIIENIFALPGIGRLILVAVEQRDIILLQGLVIFITLAVIITNLIIDLIYTVIDPRIKA